MSIIKEQISMQAHAQSINAISGEIIAGPNGDFISFTLKNGDTSTLAEDGGSVATANQYVGQGVESF